MTACIDVDFGQDVNGVDVDIVVDVYIVGCRYIVDVVDMDMIGDVNCADVDVDIVGDVIVTPLIFLRM